MKTITKTKINFLPILSIAAAMLICSTTNIYAATNRGADQSRSGFYFGVDAIRSFVKHQYTIDNNHIHNISTNGYGSNKEENGFGLNLGYKIALNKAFIAPEIFYDNLDNSAKDFGYEKDPAIAGHRLEVNNRYGAKINFGYNIFSKLNVFVNAGAANVIFSTNLYSVGKTRTSVSNFVPIYGAGLSVDLSDQWLLKASYDWQQFTIRFAHDFERDRITIETARIGLAYKF